MSKAPMVSGLIEASVQRASSDSNTSHPDGNLHGPAYGVRGNGVVGATLPGRRVGAINSCQHCASAFIDGQETADRREVRKVSDDAELKVAEIRLFLERLTDSGCAWELSDHWAADLTAVGVCRPGDPGRLAYVSVWGQDPGMYYVELEVPAGAEEIYSVASAQDGLALADAVTEVGQHLSVSEAPER